MGVFRHEGNRLGPLLPVEAEDLPFHGPDLLGSKVLPLCLTVPEGLAEDTITNSGKLHVDLLHVRTAEQAQRQQGLMSSGGEGDLKPHGHLRVQPGGVPS